MKYGMNLLLWTDRVTEEHLSVLERLKGMGYDGVELPMFQLDVDEFAQWGRRLDDLGLERTGVTVRTAADDPMSSDPKIRQAGIEANKLALECCQAAGMKLLVGPYHSALGEFSGAGPTDEQRRRAADSMRQVAEYAETCDVTLAVEYLNRFECYLLNSARDAVEFVRMVDHPRCRTMYDTFHAHIEEKDPVEAIHACSSDMAHVHISENDRSTPGQGQVNWQATFDTLAEVGYDGWLMIEAFGLALPALAAATKIWRRMYESEDQLARDGLTFMKRQWEARARSEA